MIKVTLIISSMLIVANVRGGTVLDFWHTYTHAQTRQAHYSFHLAHYKRGLFWGSCGPSTKSQQWAFSFDLAGEGPAYPSSAISVSDDNGKALRVVSGQVTKDVKRARAKIEIEVESGGSTNKFIGNGEYAIKKLK
jgi:hypothetical protein